MDNQSSWTKTLSHKSDKSTQQSYQNSFEFLDMSACDESQKLKLKSTLEMPAAPSSAPRDRTRSNFTTRNVSIKPQHYHLNNYVKTQRNYPSKFPNTLEQHETRSYTDGNNFCSNKIHSNFNNQNPTNINDRHFSNTQDKVCKWNNKKTTVPIKDSETIASKETSTKRTGGEKERYFHNQQLKDVPRESGKNYSKNTMSPPPPYTNFQTSTTPTSSTSSNQGNMAHYQYGAHQMYPQMYPPHHLDQINQNSSQLRGGMGRRGRSRGGNNGNRRDFQNPRHHNHQQNQQTNDYGQPLLDQNQQGAVISSAQYQPVYFHYPWQNAMPQNMNMATNLTGQPLFAIQQPLMYQYGSPYPIMYNLMPQAHPMSHHQPELAENELQEPPIPWQAHAQPIYHHSPLGAEFQTHPEDYQLIDASNDYQQEEIDPEITFVDVEAEETYVEKEEELVEKTRDLMIQTTPPPSEVVEEVAKENGHNFDAGLEHADPEMVPNFSAQKKQTASVSVSAIPNQDRHETDAQLTEVLEPRVSSFSSITASKHPILEHKKTENNHNEVQQTALIERAKQQIVTTIIGSSKEMEKKEGAGVAEVKVEEVIDEKIEMPSLPSPPASSTWAGLFNSKSSVKPLTPPQPQPILTSPQNHIHPEPPKPATNFEVQFVPTPITNGSQVPVTAMSYSAVSAQSITPVAKTNPSQQNVGVKNLPQTKKTNAGVDENSNNKNSVNCNPPPVDQHSLKLGDFFSSYKIESSSIAIRPRGLLNKSNYCYINAILQALVSCPPFYHLMKAIPPTPLTYRNHTKTPVTDAMVELVSNYSLMPYRKWSPREKGKKDEVPEITRDSAFEPSVILKMLQTLRTTEMFPVEGRQEDAEEFLSFILNRMNDEMIEMKKIVEKPKEMPKEDETQDDINGNVEAPGDDDDEWQVISGTRNKSTITRTTDFGRSPISDIFGGKLKVRVHREGDHSSDNIEPFFTLKLVIEKASSVKEALEILVGRDQLEGVLGRTNQEVAAWQQVTLEELPVVLILHLKCFDFKKDGCTKILKTVEFPIELKLDQKLIASKNKYQQKQKQYKLFAVVYHDGKEVSKGHYITDVFHLSYSSWIRYDDSTVKPIPESSVLHPKSPRVPYLLFYRRADTIGHKISTK